MENFNIEEELLCMKSELWNYARNLVWDRDKAEDLLQETVLKILCNADKFCCGTDFRKWARCIMRNAFLNSVTRVNPVVYIDGTSFSGFSVGSSAHEQCSDVEMDVQGIYDAINSLPSSRCKVVSLHIMGYKYDEIASILQIPTGTVKSRINTSRLELRESLKDYLD